MIKNALFLFFMCAAVFAFYLPSYLKMQSLSERNRAYEKRIAELERDNKVIAAERERLIKDPDYFEKVAREKMGIIKEGEVIYKMVPAGSKKAGAEVSDDEKALLKKEEPSAPVSSKTKTGAKKTVQKKKTSATMSKSKTAKSKTPTALKKTTTTKKSTAASSSKD